MRVDVRFLLEEALRILNSGSESPVYAKNQLKKFSLGFKFIQLKIDKLKKMKLADQQETFDKWEHYFITVTKWMMYFDEFQKLSRHLQVS